MLLSEGQMSDYKGAALMLSAMPKAKQLLADKGYDADWLRAALAKRGITPCIPSKANRKTAIPHDAVLYKQRHRIENMFGRPLGIVRPRHGSNCARDRGASPNRRAFRQPETSARSDA
jgi:transposase